MQTMNKILAGHSYVANFLGLPVRPGMIYRMDDDQFIPALHFNDHFPAMDLSKVSSTGSRGVLKFSESRDVSITTGGAPASGLAPSEIRLSFRRKRSVAGAMKDAVTTSIRYVPLEKQLRAIWLDHDFEKYRRQYVFVYEVVTAASSTLIYSQESNNTVVLAQTKGAKVSKLADLASGEFEYVANSKRTLEIIRNTAHRPLFKAFRFRRNWQPEILG